MPIAAEIYYHVYEGGEEGRKPPVVLIHGAGGTHLYWPSEIRRLPGYRIFALDLPGHGKSGGRGQQTIQAYAQAVMDWMEAVGLDRAVLTGHSMGSAIALSLTLDCPEKVMALALIGAGARLRVAPSILESAANPDTFQLAVNLAIVNSFGPTTPPRLVELAAKRMGETRPSVLHGDFLACNTFDATEKLGKIVQPAWICCGAEDRMTPLRYSQFLAGSIPNARLEVIPNSGHMVMLEKPQTVAAALSSFLNTLLFR